MKIKQLVLKFVLIILVFFALGCEPNSPVKPISALTDKLDPGVKLNNSGVGVAIADMNGDGHLDIVSAGPNGVKYFESNGDGAYFDRGVIADPNVRLNNSGLGVAIADLDGNGVPDMVVSSPNGIYIFKNPVPPKK